MADAPEPAPAEIAAEARVDAATANAVATEATLAASNEAVENSAVVAAQEEVARAEATARDIALAATQTEVGRQVESHHQENVTWRNEHSQEHERLSAQMAAHTQALEEIRSQLTEALTRLPPMVQVSSTPQASESPAAETTVVVPTQATPPQSEGEDAPKAPRRRTRFL